MSFGKKPGPKKFGGREKRRHDRQRVNHPAAIVTQDGKVIPCEIVDWSETGALLAVTSVLGIPQRFNLEPAAGGSYPVEMVRRNVGRIGVRFIR